MLNEKLESMINAAFPIKERTLILGAGEIGRSLKEILDPHFEVIIKDKDAIAFPNETYGVIHICYPYSDKFVEITKNYISLHNPRLVIVHSTVRPGTIEQLPRFVVHSPVNGKHPNLAKSMLTFTKVVGGNDVFAVYEAVKLLNLVGVKTHVFSNSRTSELAKVLCTTQYGWHLVLMKEIARICNEFKVPFHEVYTEWNNIYNQGYSEFGEMRFMRPNLFPMDGPIGGHCVIPNCNLLDDFITSTIKGRNDLYKLERILEASGQGPDSRKSEGAKIDDKSKRKNRRNHKGMESGVK